MVLLIFRLRHLMPRGSNSRQPLSRLQADDPPPAVHVIDPNGDKWGVCLNRVAKWVAGLVATLAASLLAGAFAFAWQSNARLSKLDNLPAQIDWIQAQSFRNSEDIAEIKGRLGMPEAAVSPERPQASRR